MKTSSTDALRKAVLSWIFYSCAHGNKIQAASNAAWQSRSKRGAHRPRKRLRCRSLQALKQHTVPHRSRTALSSLYLISKPSPFTPPPPPFRPRCLQCGIISTAFHYYDNTLWGLKAIETLRETSNFMPPGKFIYFLSPNVISRGGKSGGGEEQLKAPLGLHVFLSLLAS